MITREKKLRPCEPNHIIAHGHATQEKNRELSVPRDTPGTREFSKAIIPGPHFKLSPNTSVRIRTVFPPRSFASHAFVNLDGGLSTCFFLTR
jgi:hypothetical protein